MTSAKYSDFDYDDFASQFDLPARPDLVEADTANGQNNSVKYWQLDYSQQDDSGDSEEIIYGEYPVDNRSDSGFDSRPGTAGSRDQRTDTADEQLERERLARARSTAGSLHRQSSAEHGGSDDARWIDEQNQRAVKEAIRRLNYEREVTPTVNKVGTGEPGRSIAVPTSAGGLTEREIATKPIVADDFTGCTFIAGLHRLYLNNNGEWLVQFRVAFESKSDARELDMASGMALKVSVERV